MRQVAVLLLALAAGCRTPGELTLTGGTAADPAPATLLAGTADVVYTPPPGYPLGGYGGGERREEWPFYLGLGWPGRLSLWAHQVAHEEGPGRADMLKASIGVHDELTARALVLRPARGAPLAFVRIDAIGVTRELHDLVVSGLAELGYARSTVVLSATHTHSGVGAFMRPPLARLAGTDNFRPEVEARIAGACVRAVREAHAAARPAAIGVGRAKDEGPDGKPVLARNRTQLFPRETLDPEVLLLRVDDAAAGTPMALLINYAIHGTVLGPDNLQYSGDAIDGLEDEVAARLGVPVLFLNGAEGDIAPGKPPVPGGKFERMRALGAVLADLVAPRVPEIRTSPEVRIATATGELELGEAHAVLALGRERLVDDYRDVGTYLLEPLLLPFELPLWVLGLTNVDLRLSWSLGLGLLVDLDAYAGRTDTRVAGVRLTTDRDDIVFLTVPGEATHDVGGWIKRQARERGATTTFVAGLSQDHIGYLASEALFRAGCYEARLTLFGPETAAHVVRAHGRLLDALGFAPAKTASAADPPAEER